jgi:hypothetical protein
VLVVWRSKHLNKLNAHFAKIGCLDILVTQIKRTWIPRKALEKMKWIREVATKVIICVVRCIKSFKGNSFRHFSSAESNCAYNYSRHEHNTAHWRIEAQECSIQNCPHETITETGEGVLKNWTKLRGLSPRANYTHRATAACRRSDCQLLRIEFVTWSAWRIPTAVFSVF